MSLCGEYFRKSITKHPVAYSLTKIRSSYALAGAHVTISRPSDAPKLETTFLDGWLEKGCVFVRGKERG